MTHVLHPLVRWTATALTAMALAGGVALVGDGVAQAADQGRNLSFFPDSGTDATPMWITAEGPCPAAATRIRAIAFGKGFGPQGTVVLTNSVAGMSITDAFTVPLSNSMKLFAQQRGVTVQGPYSIRLDCTDVFAQKVFGSFTGVVTYNSKQRYTAPAGPAPEGYIDPSASTAAVPSASSPASSASASAPSGPGSPAASSAVAAPSTPGVGGEGQQSTPGAAASTPSSGVKVAWPVFLLGAALLVGAAVLAIARPRAAAGAQAAPEPAENDLESQDLLR